MSFSIFLADADFDDDKVIAQIPIPHRYWRLHVISSGNGFDLSANELELRESVGGADVTGSPATYACDHIHSSSTIAAAFDNDTSTGYNAPGDGVFPINIDVDFTTGHEKDIHEISWLSRPDAPIRAPVDMDILWSDDGTTWNLSWSERGISGWSSGVAKIFTKP